MHFFILFYKWYKKKNKNKKTRQKNNDKKKDKKMSGKFSFLEVSPKPTDVGVKGRQKKCKRKVRGVRA